MDLKDRLDEIRTAIKSGRFGNEASISQGVVLPLLHSLGWPIFDTAIVSPEYAIEGTRADYALCYPAGKPTALIEVKRHGQSDGAEQQLFLYAFHNGVQLAILTDGQEWNFFLPAEQGNYGERRVYKLDIVERDADECVLRLTRYLEYEAVRSGKALAAAREDYRNVTRERQMQEMFPKAWALLISEEDELLLELLADRVEILCGYKPELDDAASFLKARFSPSSSFQNLTSSTRPSTQAPTLGTVRIGVGHTSDPIGFTLDGQYHSARNAKDTLVKIFESLTARDHSFPERFAALPRHGSVRRYLAQNPNDLFPGRPDLVSEYSVQLGSGWWLGTNNGRESIRKIISLACEVSHVQYGHDLQVQLGD